MSAPVRLVLFGLLLLAVFVASLALGAAIDSSDASPPPPAHEIHAR